MATVSGGSWNRKAREPGIRGVVADIIHVQKDYEVAIETALGGSIQNIVTDNEQTAKRMIGFLKQNRYGRATFLPLSNISGRGGFTQRDALKEPGVIGTANTLVQADAEYSELVQYLLGRVLVVDNIDHAIAIGKKYRHSLRMVTIEGESLSPGGSMTGGAFRNNSNLLGRRREIEELEKNVALRKKELETTQRSILENREQRNKFRDMINELQQKLRGQYIEQNTAKMNLEQLQEKAQEIQKNYRQIDRDQDELRHQAVARSVRITKISQKSSKIPRKTRKSWKPLSRRSRLSWMNGKQKRLPSRRNWSRSVWILPLWNSRNISFRKT